MTWQDDTVVRSPIRPLRLTTAVFLPESSGLRTAGRQRPAGGAMSNSQTAVSALYAKVVTDVIAKSRVRA